MCHYEIKQYYKVGTPIHVTFDTATRGVRKLSVVDSHRGHLCVCSNYTGCVHLYTAVPIVRLLVKMKTVRVNDSSLQYRPTKGQGGG